MSVTIEEFRRAALALPETSEQDHFGKPSFRVGGKIFATLWVVERHAVLKLSLEDQEMLCADQPTVFTVTPWGQQGWTRIELDQVEAPLFFGLLKGAWKRVAPKRLHNELEATAS
jgi:hypothetical protein